MIYADGLNRDEGLICNWASHSEALFVCLILFLIKSIE